MTRRLVLGLGCLVASSCLAVNAAHAMDGPTSIQIDGGQLGPLELSGGVDGYGYVVSGLSNGRQNNGVNVGSALTELQKTTGRLQFTIEVGSVGGDVVPGTLTTRPVQTTVGEFSTGPLYAGYITIAPKDSPFSFSAGRFGSVEGYESGVDWNDPSQLLTDIWWVQNAQYSGIEASYNRGPISATVTFGDGWDTHVFNFLQAIATYTFNANNNVNIYYGGNLGRTGLNARTYSWSSDTTVAEYGPYFINSQLVGGWYSYTVGNLNLVPEIQYVYAKVDHQLGINKATANLGVDFFGDYSFSGSPYSIGGWIEYENSQGSGDWFYGAQSEGVGFAVSPAWQFKDLFARINAGGFYLLNNKYDGTSYGYGDNNEGKFQFTGTLEAGLLF